MLLHLHVKNFALMDEVEVDFAEGLNILTGETGAGKSVLLGSVNLVLGAKAEKDMIRSGCEYALVELVFGLDNEAQKNAVLSMDLPVEEGNQLILQRKIMPSRSICKVCGETVTVSQLKELAPILLDVYGQHDYQSLLQPKKHLAILDSFGDASFHALLSDYREKYCEYTAVISELNQPQMSESERERELSFARFEVDEIEEADLKEGEPEELEIRLKRLENHEKITSGLSTILYLLKDSDSSCQDALSRCVREIYAISNVDAKLDEFSTRLQQIDMDLTYLTREISDYIDGNEFDEQECRRVRERVDLYNHLMMKYGKTVKKVLAYCEETKARIAYLENLSEEGEKLIARKSELEKELLAYSMHLTEMRKKEAAKISKEIMESLLALNFLQATFEVSFTELEAFGPNGKDAVTFMISTNAGEPVKNLSSVASGGELSRIMLAIKTISARRDEINTLIFDEIDSGISGKTAWKVSEMLGTLAKDRQIIAITHLPQIAAMADVHYNIVKMQEDSYTKTEIIKTDENGLLAELARMLGGDELSDAAMENAKELRNKAKG